MRDSNPRKRSQSPVCYRYTNPLNCRSAETQVLLYRALSICQALFFKKQQIPQIFPRRPFPVPAKRAAPHEKGRLVSAFDKEIRLVFTSRFRAWNLPPRAILSFEISDWREDLRDETFDIDSAPDVYGAFSCGCALCADPCRHAGPARSLWPYGGHQALDRRASHNGA